MKFNTLFVTMISALLLSCSNSTSRDKAAEDFIDETYQWSQQLTTRGQNMGDILFDMIEGVMSNSTPLRSELIELQDTISDGIRDFEDRPLPPLKEIQEYRAAYIEYLQWQTNATLPVLEEAITVAQNDKLPPVERGRIIQHMFQKLNSEELAWKADIDNLASKVYNKTR